MMSYDDYRYNYYTNTCKINSDNLNLAITYTVRYHYKCYIGYNILI